MPARRRVPIPGAIESNCNIDKLFHNGRRNRLIVCGKTLEVNRYSFLGIFDGLLPGSTLCDTPR